MNRRENLAATLACGLAEEVVRTFGEVRLRVFGTSMVPAILPGDLVSVQRTAIGEISSGEIVLYSREGRMFVHRVVACAGQSLAAQGDPFLTTRGDRLLYNDPPVTSTELLGRVISIERAGHQVEPPARPNGSNYSLLRLLQISDHATYLYLRLSKVWRALVARRAECRA
jgi:signal peptidase I